MLSLPTGIKDTSLLAITVGILSRMTGSELRMLDEPAVCAITDYYSTKSCFTIVPWRMFCQARVLLLKLLPIPKRTPVLEWMRVTVLPWMNELESFAKHNLSAVNKGCWACRLQSNQGAKILP